MLDIVDKTIKESNYKFSYIDLGGGMGIQYKKNSNKLNYKKYNLLIKSFLKKNKVKIIFEPGRSIIGSAGFLLTKIIYIKQTNKINFIILDTAMNDMMRPALYKAEHMILPSKFQKIRLKEDTNL